MKSKSIALIIFIFSAYNVFADIAPNPIKAKGIIASANTDVRMVSERVVVDLYRDSSVVECLFIMKNDGAKQHIQIGFPEMNFHYMKRTTETDFSMSFRSYENDKQIQAIERYMPESKLRPNQEVKTSDYVVKYEEQPWYLWGSFFDEGETKIIKVCYSLPSGRLKNGTRYFTYLLNTGSGWKGSIDTAEVIVNIKDFSSDLIGSIFPENNCIQDSNQIKWLFTNLEPSINDDIKIYYEPYKGYVEKIRKPQAQPTIVVNGKIIPNEKTSGDGSFFKNFDTKEIVSIDVLKDSDATKKYTSTTEGVVVIYTKDFAIEKLEKLIASRISKKKVLSYDSSFDFLENYKLAVDSLVFENNDLLVKVLELKDDEINNIVIVKKSKDKTCIQINRK